jgi:hypothetical protein
MGRLGWIRAAVERGTALRDTSGRYPLVSYSDLDRGNQNVKQCRDCLLVFLGLENLGDDFRPVSRSAS